ncbi:RND family efflux transporter, MFP subunit [Lentimicrobium saccharophilum]|uniref:RND family efflux transporter, MFP subunit n=1 Tax=Lentimicrobium saccharophilum TaxID=1678841 RepID=A0A0S7BUZ8_9BACT|nr:efflux RND transporter periplasmic adaptor subunit [Lentimicrobium saccharophilum]GAP41970.1 RND family efflux transporter, MFP subunit [Lentimicrobium saccharophilum]
MKRKTRLILISLLALAAGAGIVHSCKGGKAALSIDTAGVEKGNVSITVTATGTLEAITTVEVGTQVSGVIERLYADFNSVVKKGQLLAKLDETMLRATLDQSEATLMDAEADLSYQNGNYQRMKSLYDKNLIAQADFDQAEYSYKRSLAGVASAKASLQRNQVNLAYASIYSPIDGVVLNRAVDEGQTVAASFNTPTLFTIANDLTRMEVQASVDEADIGQVREGQRVEFTVDAFPSEEFEGTVTEIRLKPVVTSNVVTYTVIINAPNPEKKLMPGMTASVNIFLSEADTVLIIPSKALKFKPESENTSGKTMMTRRPERGEMVWVYEGGRMLPRSVKTGLSDGSITEIISGLKEGEEVILSAKTAEKSQKNEKTASSPFVPKRPGSANKNNPPQPPPQ